MSEAREFKHIGQRTIRPDGFDKVTGKANYGADLSLPGMIWGANRHLKFYMVCC